MNTTEIIKKELKNLVDEEKPLLKLAADDKDTIEFGRKYQRWYSKAIKIVEGLAPERLQEFYSYYLIDNKRKTVTFSNYVIQDYIKGMGARTDIYNEPLWDSNNTTMVRVINQIQILSSLTDRIDSVLQDVTGHLFSELQDKELEASSNLLKINTRASGALAGVVLERHLQRAATNHRIKISKKNPTIADLNDPLKQANIYDIPTWRKIQFLADIRNLCSHQKKEEPSKEQVEELISGVNSIIKTVF